MNKKIPDLPELIEALEKDIQNYIMATLAEFESDYCVKIKNTDFKIIDCTPMTTKERLWEPGDVL